MPILSLLLLFRMPHAKPASPSRSMKWRTREAGPNPGRRTSRHAPLLYSFCAEKWYTPRLSTVSNRQNLGGALADCHGVLELRRQLAVLGQHGPLVRHGYGLVRPGIDHGLYVEGHSRAKLYPAGLLPVVRHSWFLVQLPAHAVSNVLTHDREAEGLDVRLNRRTNVMQEAPGPSRQNALGKGLLCNIHQTASLVADLADGDGDSGISVIPLEDDAHVDLHQVAL